MSGARVTELDQQELLARATAAAGVHRPGAEVSGLRRLEGGVSSLTFASSLRGTDGIEHAVVLKVAPPGRPPVRNRDVLRQARLLSRLAGRPGIHVPAVWFTDAGTPPFFGMQLAPGDCWEPLTNHAERLIDAATVAARARAAARMLGALQRLPLDELGLAGEPRLSMADEVQRWAALLATVEPDIAPGHDDVHRRLMRTLPPPVAPTLLHGDYRLGNMLFDGARLSAVIDWEIWSVGDPRADLAWLLMHTDPVHRFVDRPDPAEAAAAAGMPSAAQLLQEYLAVRPGAPAELDWFHAYCLYKVAATVSVFVKRNRRLAEPDPAVHTVGTTLPAVLARARELLDTIDPE